MKKRALKNFLACLMTLAMVLTLIPSQAFVYEAAAATSSTSVLHYNNGHRDTVATDLSTAADSYYDDFAYDYDKIADGTVTVTAADLKTALAELMQNTLTNEVSYSSLPTYWAYTDAEDGQAGVVYFYTDNVSTSTSDLNREHVWPKSAASFYETNGGSDLHHLRPAHSNVNSARNNYEMGEFDETASGTTTVYYNGKVAGYVQNGQFEPLENVKGDVARIFLYVYLCWAQPNLFEDIDSSSLPAFDADDSKNDGTKRIESLETLLQWCYDDPVDTWEMEQNDLVEMIQGNRNVFIDYPEYAWLIFGLEVPEGIASPASGNATHGTYEPGDLSGISGADGLVVKKDDSSSEETTNYDLTTESGILDAAFSLASGKSLGQSVSLTGDITSIQTEYSETYNNISVNISVSDKTILCYRLAGGSDLAVGDNITVTGDIQNYNGTVEFVAKSTYVKNSSAEVTATPTAEPTAEVTATPTAEATATPAAAGSYQLITTLDELGEGGKVVFIGAESIAMSNTLSSGKVTSKTVTISDNAIAEPDAAVIWTVTKQDDGTYTLYNEAASQYLYITGSKTNSFKMGTEATYAFNVTVKDNGFLFQSTDTGARYITYYAGSSDFRSYASSSAVPVTLYKLTETAEAEPTATPTAEATSTPAPTQTTAPQLSLTPSATPTAKATSTPAPTALPETTGNYKLITSVDELGEGGLVVFYGISSQADDTAYAMSNTVKTNRPVGTAVEVNDGVITDPDASIVWIVTKTEDGTYTLQSAANGKYLNLKNDSTKPFVLADTAVPYTLLGAEDGAFLFQATTNERILSIYTSDFRAYKSGAKEMGTLNLYKLVAEEPAPTPVVLPAESTVTASWGNTTQLSVTVTNDTEETIKSWKVNIPVNGTVTAVYNATLGSQSEDGYTVSCPSWSKNLASGASVTFTLVIESEETVVLGDVTLLSTEVTVDAASYSVSTVAAGKSAWAGGFVANITLSNTSDTAIDNWTMEFDYADEITNIWNATIVSHEGNHYVLECMSYNAEIAANGSVSFGFSATPADGDYSEAEFENLVLTAIQ